jgi:geranylgeranyl pyrophosphate synthase
MDLKTYAIEAKKYVEEFLDTKIKCYPGLSEDIIARLKTYATSGKGVRGGLVLAMHDFYEGEVPEQAKAAAVAVELYHSEILIIDDIIDCDKLRRGLPTMHWQLQNLDTNHEVSKKRGESFAMCVGLISNYLALELLAKVKSSKAMEAMSELYVKTGFAEAQELLNDTNPKSTKEDIIKIYKEKTGTYTVAMPSLIGAYLAGAPEEDTKHFKSIGANLGVLFQLKDDLLELEGTAEEIGKSVTSDIFMNNLTFPRIILNERVTAPEQEKLKSIYGTEPSEEDVEYIRQLHKQYATTTAITALQEEYEMKVHKELAQLSKANTHLLFLIEYNKHRTK